MRTKNKNETLNNSVIFIVFVVFGGSVHYLSPATAPLPVARQLSPAETGHQQRVVSIGVLLEGHHYVVSNQVPKLLR